MQVNVRVEKNLQKQKRMVVARGCEAGEWIVIASACRFILQEGKCLKMYGGDGSTNTDFLEVCSTGDMEPESKASSVSARAPPLSYLPSPDPGSHCAVQAGLELPFVAQAGLELAPILLPQPP